MPALCGEIQRPMMVKMYQRLAFFNFIWSKKRISSNCGLSGHIVLLGSHCHQVVLLRWGVVLGPQQYLDGWCMSSGIHMTARTQGFVGERCIVTRWSMWFTSPVSGSSVVADRCINPHIHQRIFISSLPLQNLFNQLYLFIALFQRHALSVCLSVCLFIFIGGWCK